MDAEVAQVWHFEATITLEVGAGWMFQENA
jgi:hypothetical protein